MVGPWRIGKQGASGPSGRRRKQSVGRPFATGVEKWVSRQRSQEIGPLQTKCSTPASESSNAARFPGDPPFGVESSPSGMWHLRGPAPSLIELLEMALDETSWDSFSRGSAVRRGGKAGFARNVCVGLGSRESETGVPVLRSGLRDADSLLRSHAAWALARIPSPEVPGALSAQLEVEPDGVARRGPRAGRGTGARTGATVRTNEVKGGVQITSQVTSAVLNPAPAIDERFCEEGAGEPAREPAGKPEVRRWPVCPAGREVSRR